MKKSWIKKYLLVVFWLFVPFALPAQNERWVYRYNGPLSSIDVAHSIVYGGDGNLYAGGWSQDIDSALCFTVASLTSNGVERWIYPYNGATNKYGGVNAVAWGTDGNIYAAGFGNNGLKVVSLTTTGGERWVYEYNGPGNDIDEALCVAYGNDGNIYAGGRSIGSGTDEDIVVVSLTPSGGERWVYRYNDTGSSSDWAFSICYGLDGNIYTAGYCLNMSPFYCDFIVISLTAAGTERWVYKYTPGSGLEEALSIIYGSDGNIYVGGDTYGIGSDFTVISLTTTGSERWVYQYNGPGNNFDGAKSIVYGSDSNVYAGGFVSGNGTYYDFAIISLTPVGAERWVYQYSGPNNLDGARSIIYGMDENIYGAGSIVDSISNFDFTVISVTTTGNERWVYAYNGPGNDDDVAYSIVYGFDGNIYTAGQSVGNGTDFDFIVISLGTVGVEETKSTYNKGNKFIATIFRGPLRLPEGRSCRVLDITGRVVMPNQIKPGVYFIEVDGQIVKKIIKVR